MTVVPSRLVVEFKYLGLDSFSNSKPEPHNGNKNGKNIIDVEPSATFITTKVEKIEPKDPEEREHLFHWQSGWRFLRYN